MNIDFKFSSLKNAAALCLIIFALFLLYFYITQPKNYEDCVLTYLKDDGSRYAASLVDEMCEAKFKQ